MKAISAWVREIIYLLTLGSSPYSPDAPRPYRPYLPHNLISTQEDPVPLLKFQMSPRLKILISSGSKKGTQIYFLFSLKNPSKRTPNRAPVEIDTRLQDILRISRKSHKIPLNKKAVRKKRPSMFPKSGAPV